MNMETRLSEVMEEEMGKHDSEVVKRMLELMEESPKNLKEELLRILEDGMDA